MISSPSAFFWGKNLGTKQGPPKTLCLLKAHPNSKYVPQAEHVSTLALSEEIWQALPPSKYVAHFANLFSLQRRSKNFSHHGKKNRI